ncbi:MAG: gamma-glutamylcyclotransferase [Candidatus Hydrogenedentes bacterium]|nr:gamma-glutamylcyclotransferase [Candidatus Hydrogenedentota bacterium]
MDHLIFAYGTLLDPDVQEAVIGRRIEGRPDRLRGFTKSALEDWPHSFPNLVPDAESVADGRVIEVTQHELGRIDLYEGDLYVRHRVTLESGAVTWAYYA